MHSTEILHQLLHIRGLPFLLFHWDGVTDSCYSMKDSAKRSPHYATRLLVVSFAALFACVELEPVVIFPVSAEGRSATWELLVELSICFPLRWLPKIWKTPLRVLPRTFHTSHDGQPRSGGPRRPSGW